MIYKFVEKPMDRSKLEQTPIYKAYKLLDEKGSYKKLSNEEKKFVNTFFTELFHVESYRHATYKLGGWVIDFRKFTKSYVVKFKYYGWLEINAFNKTCIRKNSCTPSYILEIIER